MKMKEAVQELTKLIAEVEWEKLWGQFLEGRFSDMGLDEVVSEVLALEFVRSGAPDGCVYRLNFEYGGDEFDVVVNVYHASVEDPVTRILRQFEVFTQFHPRAMKLLVKQKPFLVIAEDEPYYWQVYGIIRDSEKEQGRWTTEDETRYTGAVTNVPRHKREQASQRKGGGYYSRLIADDLTPSDYREQARILAAEHDDLKDGDVCHCHDCQVVIPLLDCAARQSEQWEKTWLRLLKETARFSDMMGLDDGEWQLADDETLLEQFDPWGVLAMATKQLEDEQREAVRDEALTCPFCGEKSRVIKAWGNSGFYVSCPSRRCADGPFRDSQEEAIAIWKSVRRVGSARKYQSPVWHEGAREIVIGEKEAE